MKQRWLVVEQWQTFIGGATGQHPTECYTYFRWRWRARRYVKNFVRNWTWAAVFTPALAGMIAIGPRPVNARLVGRVTCKKMADGGQS